MKTKSIVRIIFIIIIFIALLFFTMVNLEELAPSSSDQNFVSTINDTKMVNEELAQVTASNIAPLSYTFIHDSYTVTGIDDSKVSANANEKINMDIIIPATYDDNVHGEHPVTAIGNNAFSGYTQYRFTSLDLIGAINLTEIGVKAFYDVSDIAGELYLPNTLKTIGDFAFKNCSSFIGNLTIPASIADIGSGAFSSCTGFGSLTFEPNSQLTRIKDDVFKECSGLTGELTIPGSIR